MKISIIIPAYNAEKTISKCIESVLNQTYKNIEIIIINDGSKDSTSTIISEYADKDKRIVFIDNENHGVSYSRNIGIEKSTGEYITFIDSDDWYEKNAMELLISKIREEKVDVIVFNKYVVKNDIKKIPYMYELSNKKYEKDEIYKKDIIKHFLLYNNCIDNHVQLLFIKSSTIKNKIKFNEKLYMMEDVYFYQCLFNITNSIYFYDKPLYNYSINTNSVSRSPEKKLYIIKGIIIANEELNKLLKKLNLQEYIIPLRIVHLKIVLDRIYTMELKKIKNVKQIITEMENMKNYSEMLKTTSYKIIPQKYKLPIKLLQRKRINTFSLYIVLRNNLKKIKWRNK